MSGRSSEEQEMSGEPDRAPGRVVNPELAHEAAEAAAVASAFTASLESAKDAAVTALPQRGTAA